MSELIEERSLRDNVHSYGNVRMECWRENERRNFTYSILEQREWDDDEIQLIVQVDENQSEDEMN